MCQPASARASQTAFYSQTVDASVSVHFNERTKWTKPSGFLVVNREQRERNELLLLQRIRYLASVCVQYVDSYVLRNTRNSHETFRCNQIMVTKVKFGARIIYRIEQYFINNVFDARTQNTPYISSLHFYYYCYSSLVTTHHTSLLASDGVGIVRMRRSPTSCLSNLNVASSVSLRNFNFCFRMIAFHFLLIFVHVFLFSFNLQPVRSTKIWILKHNISEIDCLLFCWIQIGCTRCVDKMQTQNDLAPTRVGMAETGFSGGYSMMAKRHAGFWRVLTQSAATRGKSVRI